ncbi:MAG TPA: PSD1 and planctomycete cytochrome C domain-containing protein [Pirellulales bacterium]|nr:PSD1 and planctomycete cytochrome C domain-containing protein [Pirellulales bacterium]
MNTALLIIAALAATPQAPPAAGPPVDFQRQVQPIFARHCTACHGPAESEAGLQLTRKETAFAELESGERAVVPGDLKASALWQRLSTDDESERMPPEGEPLTDEQKDVIRRWILQGATWQEHWAFISPQPQQPPPLKQNDWARNPIDAFVLNRLEARDLLPAPPAGKRELIRRAYYDLTGLPPTPEEVGAFVADSAVDAYENLVDRLLASPQYGERWARHWMDIIRYAETNSYERDAAKPFVWRYRDYIIRAFNDDKPYDQFIREQLAGDELDQATADAIVATGFYRLGLFDDESADPYKHYFDQLDDMVTTTSQAFLGLTINCSRCHDHKIDPIPQEDYYRMLAFFRNIKRYSVDQRNILKSIRMPGSESAALRKLDHEKEEIAAQLDKIATAARPHLEGVDRDEFKYDEWRTRILRKNIPKAISQKDYDRYVGLVERRQALLFAKVPGNQLALAVVEDGRVSPKTFLLGRGNPRVEVRELQPGYPALFGSPDPVIPSPPPDATSSHRRKILADWIASKDNMLTARVMMNRLWQYLFGRGIVRTPNNFGLRGAPPTHPELLDWLAGEFMQGGWRIKRMQRMILTSNAYRMSSRSDDAKLAADSANDLLWRQNMRRLSAEEIRDSILAVDGTLNLQSQGPSIYPKISREVLHSLSMPGVGWGRSSPGQQARRSVYIHVKRNLVTPILKIFDFAETDLSCPVRFETTQPTQALPMMNGEFTNQQARLLAARARRERPGGEAALAERARRIMELAWQRPATDQQVQEAVTFMRDLRQADGATAERALEVFSLMAINSNEFMYLD